MSDPGGGGGGVLKLRCSIQNYDWGIRGEESTVSRLFERNSGGRIVPEKPYAEFWMGTHESGPSFVGDRTLKSWVEENPRVLGEKVLEKWGPDLPFLFKVIWFLFIWGIAFFVIGVDWEESVAQFMSFSLF